VREGDVVELRLPTPRPLDLEPADIPLDVLFEDGHLLVVDKPAGLVVHPAPGHERDTLVNALLGRHTALSGIGGVLRPGIVHRLDRDTSGVMVVAKSDAAHLGLARQLEGHSMEREYQALAVQVRGPGLAESGTFETLFGRHPVDRARFTGRVQEGKRAVTHYRVTARYRDGALAVTCRLETGRTHQIRVHLSEAGAPVLGDSLYGGKAMQASRLIARQALHAGVLGFRHPVTGQGLRFEVAPPEDYRRAQAALEAGESWR
jgi:23S rRNA pseudouridine1911/1915/1917 synthase